MFHIFEGAGSGGYVPQLPVIHLNFSPFLVDHSSSDQPHTTSSRISALHHV
jgi:hypothetical protein